MHTAILRGSCNGVSCFLSNVRAERKRIPITEHRKVSFACNALKSTGFKRPTVQAVQKESQSSTSQKLTLESLGKMLSLGSVCFLWSHEAMASVAPSLTAFHSPALQGVVSAFLLILFSEIGDKTFFVAFLLALQNSKSAVFTGTFGALAIMTLVSVGLGQALHQIYGIIPESISHFPLDDVLAIILLVWFGVLTLQSAGDAEAKAAAEQEEAEEGVKGLAIGSGGLILSTFALVFSAEWGDKSFLATTALSAASSPFGVTLGALGGHLTATVLAIAGGSFLSNYVSEKSVQYIGGSLFLVFALKAAIDLFKQL